MLQHSLTDSREEGTELHEQLTKIAHHGFFFDGAALGNAFQMERGFHNFDLPCQIIFLFIRKTAQNCPVKPFYKHAHHIFRQPGYLFDLGKTSHMIYLGIIRIILFHILLANQENPLIAHHSLFHCQNGFCAA